MMIRKINFQPMLKPEVSLGKSLLVHSIFFTIQGEGPHVGKPAVFVRLGGCNLQCPGCDTAYTDGTAFEPIDSIMTRIKMAFGDYPKQAPRLVVVTGGEPFRQNIIPLVHALFNSFIQVQIETNGTLGWQTEVPAKWANSYFKPQIVVSPKSGKINGGLFPYVVAYKYVLDANHIDWRDGLPTSVLGMPISPARPHIGFDGDVYVQPAEEFAPELYADGKDRPANEQNLAIAVNSAMKFGYRLGLQTHKIAGLD